MSSTVTLLTHYFLPFVVDGLAMSLLKTGEPIVIFLTGERALDFIELLAVVGLCIIAFFLAVIGLTNPIFALSSSSSLSSSDGSGTSSTSEFWYRLALFDSMSLSSSLMLLPNCVRRLRGLLPGLAPSNGSVTVGL